MQVVIVSTIYILCHRVEANVRDYTRGSHLGSGDFSKIVNTTTFVDKTMLIQELFSHKIVLLTAPQCYGKSTNLDMLKRFLEIKVDENGKPKDVQTTEDYNLFVKNNLNIVQNKQFFNEHFGKHPVIYIDFSGISGLTNFESLLLKLAKVQRDTFERHKYLLKNTELWADAKDREMFYTHFHTNYSRLSEKRIRYGFKWLSELLCEHFEKPVFVLIDRFDTFLDNIHKPTHNNNTTYQDKTRIFGFIRFMNIEMFKYNDENVKRALVLGDSLDSDIDVYPDNVQKDSVMYEETFGKYFGINETELEGILSKLTNNVEEREKLKRSCIEEREQVKTKFKRDNLWKLYGYLSEPPFNKIYSFKPPTNYMQDKLKLSD